MKLEPLADKIIDMYQNKNMTTVQIARSLGCHDSSVGRLLERHQIERIHTPNELVLNTTQADAICKMYLSGMTTIEIGKIYGICDRSVSKILRNNNVEVRKAVRRSKIKNHDYFSEIDSSDKAYFLGWMISDGAIIDNKTRPDRSDIISLEIHHSDIEILYKFAESLGAERDCVKINTSRNHAYLRFASSKMAKDLARFGVVPRKSHITFLPMLNKEMMPHLIRGIFDGDGTVTISGQNGYAYPHFAFYGSKEICEDISRFLHNEIGISQNKVSKTTCYHVWWGGKTPSDIFYRYIYNNSDGYCLDRKRKKFITE